MNQFREDEFDACHTDFPHPQGKTACHRRGRETMGLRVYRAISWIGRAEACDGDDDARFIFLWIAFNAVYADKREFQYIPQGECAA